jgi:hypothetical protein
MNNSGMLGGRGKLPRSRRPFAAVTLLPLVLLAVAGIKLLPPTALQQPTAVHQLLHGAGYFNASLDSSAAAQYAAASANGQPSPAGTGPSAERRLRVLVLGHDLSLTGAPQALLEIARHLRDQGHTLSFMFLRGGPLNTTLSLENFSFTVITDVQVCPHACQGAAKATLLPASAAAALVAADRGC